MSEVPLRDSQWLEQRVKHIWDTYYSDGPSGYPIRVRFGPKARYRYGSIYSRGEACYVLVNALFAHPDVPEYVVDATLAHELAHYVHGYGSGLRKLHAHPHRGGVVDKEMEKRGCLFLEVKASEWRRTRWQDFYTTYAADILQNRADREKRNLTAWQMYLNTPGFRTEEYLRSRLQALAPRFGFSEVPFAIQWLYASPRRNGLSYRFHRDNVIRLHGTLADPSVPDDVVDYEICYWLAVYAGGTRWDGIEQAMRQARVWERARKGIQWRRKAWDGYYVANNPLSAK